MEQFQLVSEFKPMGDQPRAVQALVRSLGEGRKYQTLLGVTGSGKTFTMAKVIEALGRPTLVISHNKTLAAQLYSEFKEFFPDNAVAYFVSYYDYYQPEAYIPARDIYIEKDASINDDIDRLRLAATSALMSRRDVIVVASVSCIYGIGNPEDYRGMVVPVHVGLEMQRDELLGRLVDVQYERNDVDFSRGKFRVRGDSVEIYPSYKQIAYHVEFFGDTVDRITTMDPTTGEILEAEQEVSIFPAKHYVMPEDRLERGIASIEAELDEHLKVLRDEGKLLEAQRLAARTKYDLEMLREVGYCSGIENYSRHFSGRSPGQPPYTLMNYFPDDYLVFVDESHATIPQLHAMYEGDRSRKSTLIEHGFRMPSALDNRPLRFDEWEEMIGQAVFVSATPGDWEIEKSEGEVVEQVIRPTGLVDPQILIEPATGQVEHLHNEIKNRVAAKQRTLVTTLTKRLAEDLTDYFRREGIRCEYLHSEVQTFERSEILKQLRLGRFDVVIGVNLLREGLDLPEVSLVAILDADREGFLRSQTSLLQTIGRCARHVDATVILYADNMTGSMQRAIDETTRRRSLQAAYNRKHNIKPKTVKKAIRDGIEKEVARHRQAWTAVGMSEIDFVRQELVKELEEQMHKAASELQFERAAEIRDRIEEILNEPGKERPIRQPRRTR